MSAGGSRSRMVYVPSASCVSCWTDYPQRALARPAEARRRGLDDAAPYGQCWRPGAGADGVRERPGATDRGLLDDDARRDDLEGRIE